MSTQNHFGSFLPYKNVTLTELQMLFALLHDHVMQVYRQIWYHLEANYLNFQSQA